jgi:hypothetical protein
MATLLEANDAVGSPNVWCRVAGFEVKCEIYPIALCPFGFIVDRVLLALAPSRDPSTTFMGYDQQDQLAV